MQNVTKKGKKYYSSGNSKHKHRKFQGLSSILYLLLAPVLYTSDGSGYFYTLQHLHRTGVIKYKKGVFIDIQRTILCVNKTSSFNNYSYRCFWPKKHFTTMPQCGSPDWVAECLFLH